MDESNHDMVNMLTHRMTIIINPLVETINQNYQLLARQMGRLVDVFGAPPNPTVNQVANALSILIKMINLKELIEILE